MDDDLRLKLKELSTTMQSRAAELALPGGNTDIAALMSGIAVTLEALLVIAEESKTPRSGPSVEPAASIAERRLTLDLPAAAQAENAS